MFSGGNSGVRAREAFVLNNPDYKISTERSYILVERSRDYEVVWSEQPAMLQKIADSCKEAGCKKVLVVGPRTRVSLSVTDIFNLGQEIAKLDLKIAVVELHDASNDDVKFLENVAMNRGGPIRFFDNQQEAEAWLGDEPQ